MKRILGLLFILAILACQAQDERMQAWYEKNKGDDQPSKSTGTPGNGALENGKLVPWSGTNFRYFDKLSYKNERAFVHHKIKTTLVDSYKALEITQPNIQWRIMECSRKEGGKLWPHRTHQNGLSVDFMMPKKKGEKPYTKLDEKGAIHYLLEFDDNGKYSKDQSVTIDFELVAEHILQLEKHARKNGLRVKKVIIKIELKDELFSGPKGKQLKGSGIYIVKALTPTVNDLHDDHYHIDFELL